MEEEEEVEEVAAAHQHSPPAPVPPSKDEVKANEKEDGVNGVVHKEEERQVKVGFNKSGEVKVNDRVNKEEKAGVNDGVKDGVEDDGDNEVDEEDRVNNVVGEGKDGVSNEKADYGVNSRMGQVKAGVNKEVGDGAGKVKDGVNEEEEEEEEEEDDNNDGHATLGRASRDVGDKVWQDPSSATILTEGGVGQQELGREELANNGVERLLGEEQEEEEVGELDDDNEEGDGTLCFLEKPSSEDDGDAEQQAAFVRGLAHFFTERHMEYKHPKFYGENLNCLKLWRAVVRLGGYDAVTNGKLWRQVGETFSPPKTCTTVSWTFRGFYEKALLDYERFKLPGIQPNAIQQSSHSEAVLQLGEAPSPAAAASASASALSLQQQCTGSVSTSGRARRDAAARAMQGWHSQRILGSGEVGDPIIKDKNNLVVKKEKQLKSLGIVKKRKASTLVRAVKAARTKGMRSQLIEHNPIVAESGYDAGINLDQKKAVKLENPQYAQNDCDSAGVLIMDDGPRADWVKINVHKTHDCFEIYALVPGLLREEVRIQCEPDGQLVINGEPDQPDNPWGITPFKKVIFLPLPIDTQQTSAVVALHGQLFVRAPYAIP